MINLVKADLYRLRRSKTLKKCLIAMVIFLVYTTISVSGEIGVFSLMSAGKYGYHFSGAGVHGSYGSLLESVLGFTGVLNICMIFLLSDVVIGRYTEGMIRVPITYGYNRFKVYLSNWIVTCIAVVGLGLFTMLVAGITWGALFTKEHVLSVEEAEQIIKVMGTWCIIMLTMISIGTLLATIIREKVVIVGLGILYMSFVSMVMCMWLEEQTLRKIPSAMMMELCTKPLQNRHLKDYVVYCTVIIILTIIGGWVASHKQDIK
ncbi:MAG: hypothetical protein ACRC1P_05610 [Cellulosilyticaceae bacterium]